MEGNRKAAKLKIGCIVYVLIQIVMFFVYMGCMGNEIAVALSVNYMYVCFFYIVFGNVKIYILICLALLLLTPIFQVLSCVLIVRKIKWGTTVLFAVLGLDIAVRTIIFLINVLGYNPAVNIESENIIFYILGMAYEIFGIMLMYKYRYILTNNQS